LAKLFDGPFGRLIKKLRSYSDNIKNSLGSITEEYSDAEEYDTDDESIKKFEVTWSFDNGLDYETLVPLDDLNERAVFSKLNEKIGKGSISINVIHDASENFFHGRDYIKTKLPDLSDYYIESDSVSISSDAVTTRNISFSEII